MYNIHAVLKIAIRTWQLPVTSILLFGVFSTLAGQNTDQLIKLTRFHMVAGQETAFIAENAQLGQAFDSQSDSPCFVYLYSDHTFEFSVPAQVKEAEALPEQLPNHFPGQVNLSSAVSKQDNRIEQYQSDLSYGGPVERLPAKMSGETYLEVVTYRVLPGNSAAVMEKLRKYPELMQEINSPVVFDCYTYQGEDESIFFELVYPAEDPDDLAERRAIQEATLTRPLQRWRKEILLLVDQLSKVTGHFVYELSSPVDQRS